MRTERLWVRPMRGDLRRPLAGGEANPDGVRRTLGINSEGSLHSRSVANTTNEKDCDEAGPTKFWGDGSWVRP